MTGKNSRSDDDLVIARFPQTLGLRDLITIISVAVSLTIAWTLFSTRLTVLEKEVVALKDNQARIEVMVDKASLDTRHIQIHQQDDEQFINELYRTANKPEPKRSGQY